MSTSDNQEALIGPSQSEDEIYKGRFVHAPLSEPTRKANRNLLLCLIAIALAWYSEATLKGTTMWGLSFSTSGAPLEPAIAVLSWLFLVNWLEPIAIDIQRLRIAAALRRKEHNKAVIFNNRNVLDWEATIKTAVNAANKADRTSAEAQLSPGVESELAEAKAGLKYAIQARRGFRLSYAYRMMVTHIAPLSAVPICTIVAFVSLDTPVADIPKTELSVIDGDMISTGEEHIRLLGFDTFGRTLAVFNMDSKDVAPVMIGEGLAVKQRPRGGWCNE